MSLKAEKEHKKKNIENLLDEKRSESFVVEESKPVFKALRQVLWSFFLPNQSINFHFLFVFALDAQTLQYWVENTPDAQNGK